MFEASLLHYPLFGRKQAMSLGVRKCCPCSISPFPFCRSHKSVLMTFFFLIVFSSFSISFFRTSLLFRVSVTSLIYSSVRFGSGLCSTGYCNTCGWRYGPCPEALMMYSSEGERRCSLLAVLCSCVLALRKSSSCILSSASCCAFRSV